ncbi:MAG: enoyl-CoA hydratase/isomerase family protein [Bacteroidota bacterium]
MYSDIIITKHNRTGLITLNKPERHNSLNAIMIKELTEGVNSLCRQNEIRVIVVTGAESAFCAGMDIGYVKDSMAKTHEENVEDARNLLKLLLTVQNAKKITIAMVNGPALGGGCGLSAACDYVFAADSKTKFGVPEVKLGFVPAVILSFLMKRMGEGRSREFVLSGEIAEPVKAKWYGLVTDIIPLNQLHSVVFEFADQLAASTSPSSIAFTKELFMRMDEMSYRDGIDFAVNLNAMVRKTEDFKKGMESFLKKEKIQW